MRVTIFGLEKVRVGDRDIVEYKSEGVKQNPNSIRFLIGHIINMRHGGHRSKAAEALFKFARYRSNRPTNNNGLSALNQDNLTTILNDNGPIAYWHLESIARSIGLPCGAFLAFSRVYSLVRGGKAEAALTFADGLREFADVLSAVAKTGEFSEEDLTKMARCFEETHRREDAATPE